MARKLKIALGDIRHNTLSRHSVFMPIGISYIASYTLAHTKQVEIRLYDDPYLLIKDIDNWKPDVIGLSNYCWNSELSRVVFTYAKCTNPVTVCISGGPEFPIESEDRRNYLLNRKEIDFYVYQEGEVAFAHLIKKIQQGFTVDVLRGLPQGGVVSINPKSNELVIGEALPRLVTLDEIPSPYLSSIMDQWFNGCYAPSIETARGCPYTCGYCFASQSWYRKVTMFSIERMKADLRYIAKRMKKYPTILLSICDSNFGMSERDEKIAEYLSTLQNKYGWPNAFDVTTGKANYDRIFHIASMLKDKMRVCCSVQSMNPETLSIIKRQNLPMDKYNKIQAEIRKRGMPSVAEYIIPMPRETKESFINGVKTLLDSGVEFFVPYTTMLLKGTYLASDACRKKYKMQSKFRILPRQFGEYMGKKCFEIEEVCVATDTMSFPEYLECRGFAFVSQLLSSEEFDIIRMHLSELGISIGDFSIHVWELIKSGKTKLSAIYRAFLEETEQELWDSKEELIAYFSASGNYRKLLEGKLGDNLLRKYLTNVLLEKCIPAIKLSYAILREYTTNATPEVLESLKAAEEWAIATRDLSATFTDESYRNTTDYIRLAYDVNAWYSSHATTSLTLFRKPVRYKVSSNAKQLSQIFEENQKLYGNELSYAVGKILVQWSIKNFWRNSEIDNP